MVAQKVWDDDPLYNRDFALLYPVMTVKQLNANERRLLRLLTYEVFN